MERPFPPKAGRESQPPPVLLPDPRVGIHLVRRSSSRPRLAVLGVRRIALGVVLFVPVLRRPLRGRVDVPARLGLVAGPVGRRARPVRVVHAPVEDRHLLGVVQLGAALLQLGLVGDEVGVDVAPALGPGAVEGLVQVFVGLVFVRWLVVDLVGHRLYCPRKSALYSCRDGSWSAWPATSSWKVEWATSKWPARQACSSSRTCGATPAATVSSLMTTWADTAGRSVPTTQACRSCTASTSGSSSRWTRTSSRSTLSGVPSSRTRPAPRSNGQAALTLTATTTTEAIGSARS